MKCQQIAQMLTLWIRWVRSCCFLSIPWYRWERTTDAQAGWQRGRRTTTQRLNNNPSCFVSSWTLQKQPEQGRSKLHHSRLRCRSRPPPKHYSPRTTVWVSPPRMIDRFAKSIIGPAGYLWRCPILSLSRTLLLLPLSLRQVCLRTLLVEAGSGCSVFCCQC